MAAAGIGVGMAVGPRPSSATLEIGIDTHGQFTTSGAIRVASILEEFNPYFFEEPVYPENVDEMARVAQMTTIPISASAAVQLDTCTARSLSNRSSSKTGSSRHRQGPAWASS